jgi:hypothetical protein
MCFHRFHRAAIGLAVLLLSCASTAPQPASLWLLPSAVVPLRLSAAVCCSESHGASSSW